MNNDVRKIKEHLRLDFECVADWRWRKAQEYPDDRRYVEAAQELDVLALTVDRVAPEILTVYAELFEDAATTTKSTTRCCVRLGSQVAIRPRLNMCRHSSARKPAVIDRVTLFFA
jgi:hypothetical protein